MFITKVKFVKFSLNVFEILIILNSTFSNSVFLEMYAKYLT